MKKLTILTLPILILSSFLLNSCKAIGEIFKAGMGFGIFIVVAVIIIILIVVLRSGKNKS